MEQDNKDRENLVVSVEVKAAMEFITSVIDVMLPQNEEESKTQFDTEYLIKKGDAFKKILKEIPDMDDSILQMHLLYGIMDIILSGLMIERARRNPAPKIDIGFEKLIEDSLTKGFSKDVS